MNAKVPKIRQEITEDQKMRSMHRAHLVIMLWIIVAVIALARAFYVQVVKHDYYVALASKQYISSTPVNFDRGAIFFTHYKKEPILAGELKTVYRIAIDTQALNDRDYAYKVINSLVPIGREQFMNKASKVNDPYEEIAKDIPEDVAKTLKGFAISGVSFVKDNKRAYPQESVGAPLLGFVGSDGIKSRGQYGIERYYDDVLSRISNTQTVNFFAELFTNIEKTVVSNTDQEEGDVMLTVDVEVQRALHNILIETKEQWKSDTIGGIIMDPTTGAIIAMDSLPSFDPNHYSSVEDPSVYINQNVSGVYEMGSIIKPLTMASALDSGVVTEKTTYDDTGFRDLNGLKVRNYDGRARGPHTTMQAILDQSLNVGIVFLVEQLGPKRFQEYFTKFGIGQETGIDLPGEAHGLSDNLTSGVLVDSATSGFGQGIAMTPIQTIRALAALGNHGVLVTPRVVDSIIYKNGTIKKVVPNEGEQVIAASTSEEISRMLVHVVDTALARGTMKMARYSIAAKTGTAQMVNPKDGKYFEDRYLHSFFGYFPAYDPKYIIFLFHTYPKGAEYASATLTDPFFKLVKFLISYYELPPDR